MQTQGLMTIEELAYEMGGALQDTVMSRLKHDGVMVSEDFKGRAAVTVAEAQAVLARWNMEQERNRSQVEAYNDYLAERRAAAAAERNKAAREHREKESARRRWLTRHVTYSGADSDSGTDCGGRTRPAFAARRRHLELLRSSRHLATG